MKTVITDRAGAVDLETLLSDLTEEEFKRVNALQSAEPSHCTGLSCKTMTACAILCEGMHCDDFEHTCPANAFCSALIKCKGFTGDEEGCKPFEKVPAGL